MKSSKPRGRPRHPDILTPAEWRVTESIRHGLTNPQIAKRLRIGPDAVKYHVSNILTKLGMASRTELQRWPGISRESPMKEESLVGNQQGIGAIGQIARSVSDIEKARRWYRDVLGLEPLMDAGNMTFFACNGIRLMLAEGPVQPESIIYFRVEAIHSEIERLDKAGAQIISAPHRIHTHEDGSEEWMAFVADSDERPIGLMSVALPE